jgi:hypothetical protein
LDLCFERVERIFRTIYAADREDLRERAEALQLKLEVIAEQVTEEQSRSSAPGGSAGSDPDALLAPTEYLRKIRLLLTQLEDQLETERHQSPFIIKLRAYHRWRRSVVDNYGTDADKETMARLTSQLDRYVEASDHRGLKFIEEQLHLLCGQIVWNQPWYWHNNLNYYRQPGRRFLNQTQATHWMEKAQSAHEKNDFPSLRTAIQEIWKLVPPDQVETAKEQAMNSGLKSS